MEITSGGMNTKILSSYIFFFTACEGHWSGHYWPQGGVIHYQSATAVQIQRVEEAAAAAQYLMWDLIRSGVSNAQLC